MGAFIAVLWIFGLIALIPITYIGIPAFIGALLGRKIGRAKGLKIREALVKRFDALKSDDFEVTNWIGSGAVTMGLDAVRKKCVFIGATFTSKIYPLSDIIDRRWEWIDHNGAKMANVIHFTIRDPANPLVSVQVMEPYLAREWMALLDAL